MLSSSIPNSKPADIPLIPPMLGKESLAKSKSNPKSSTSKKSYAQASKSSVEEVIHIKDAFPSLLTQYCQQIKSSQTKNQHDHKETFKKVGYCPYE